jgi:ABC-type multidrug transport system ATPase subunit
VRNRLRRRRQAHYQLPSSHSMVDIRAGQFEPSTNSPVTISFENVAVESRLAGLSGDFLPGELSIVLGGSGAGKSSLMAALLGTLPLSGGKIYFNGAEANLADRNYRSMIGFVPQVVCGCQFKFFKAILTLFLQHDVLLEKLSVKENLAFSAGLRLRENATERRLRVKDLLHKLRLWDVRHSIVSSISGGQRRRVSMGMELVSGCQVCFCDEVTSGLDSESAFLVMEILSTLAVQERKTIIVIIHQPSFKILKLVHHVMILRRGGTIGWDGPGLWAANEAEHERAKALTDAIPDAWKQGRHHETSSMEFDFIEPGDNLADWLLERVLEMKPNDAPISLGAYSAQMRQSRRDEAVLWDPIPPGRLPSYLRQFGVFSVQSLVQLTRNYVKLAFG